MDTYNVRRFKNTYDIIFGYDIMINDIYSSFHRGYNIQNMGDVILIEIISKINIQIDMQIITKIKNMKNINIFKILDVFDDEQNFYIVWEDFTNYEQISRDNLDINLVNLIYSELKDIEDKIILNEILCDSIKITDIYVNNNKIKILLRPQKKNKNIIYGSPMYSSPNFISKINMIKRSEEIIELYRENVRTNIMILMSLISDLVRDNNLEDNNINSDNEIFKMEL